MNEGSEISTGHPGVDEALAEVAALGEADLPQHVAAFERAHEVLRTALTSPAPEDTSVATEL